MIKRVSKITKDALDRNPDSPENMKTRERASEATAEAEDKVNEDYSDEDPDFRDTSNDIADDLAGVPKEM